MTTITSLPSPPTTSDPVSFAQRADTFFAALPNFATQANALAALVNQNSTAAASSATAAAASATSAAGSTATSAWASGTPYPTIGTLRYSLVDFQTYRKITTNVASNLTVDPANNSTDWTKITGGGDVLLTGTQTITNKTVITPTLIGSFERATTLSGTGTITVTPINGVNSASVFRYTCTANTTFVLSGSGSANNQVISFILELVNAGAFTITWPASVKWSLGNTPILTVSGTDILGFYTYDQGTTWRASVIARDSK